MFCYQPQPYVNVVPSGTTYLIPRVHHHYITTQGIPESGLIAWAKQYVRPDKLFIDIGAHTGTYALAYAAQAKDVHAFECQRLTYYGLCGGVALSGYTNVMCHQVALGSANTTAQLRVISADGGGSSILNLPRNERPLATEMVEVRTLDSFNLNDISLIKIDVEGAEADVIAGATDTLKRSNLPHVLYEANNETEFEELNRRATANLEALGYKVITLTGCSNMRLAFRP